MQMGKNSSKIKNFFSSVQLIIEKYENFITNQKILFAIILILVNFCSGAQFGFNLVTFTVLKIKGLTGIFYLL
jgi:hypothetical protein